MQHRTNVDTVSEAQEEVTVLGSWQELTGTDLEQYRTLLQYAEASLQNPPSPDAYFKERPDEWAEYLDVTRDNTLCCIESLEAKIAEEEAKLAEELKRTRRKRRRSSLQSNGNRSKKARTSKVRIGPYII